MRRADGREGAIQLERYHSWKQNQLEREQMFAINLNISIAPGKKSIISQHKK